MDWKATLAVVAPTIAKALGGPFAGAAVSAVASALGIEPSEKALEDLVTAGSPEIFAKIKAADQQFDRDMKALDIDLERIHAGDRASARDMAKVNMLPQVWLSVVFIAGYFGAMFALHGVLFQSAPLNEQVAIMFGSLIGIFTRELSGIMVFWFGSSSGSKEKTQKLEGLK